MTSATRIERSRVRRARFCECRKDGKRLSLGSTTSHEITSPSIGKQAKVVFAKKLSKVVAFTRYTLDQLRKSPNRYIMSSSSFPKVDKPNGG